MFCSEGSRAIFLANPIKPAFLRLIRVETVLCVRSNTLMSTSPLLLVEMVYRAFLLGL